MNTPYDAEWLEFDDDKAENPPTPRLPGPSPEVEGAAGREETGGG